MKKATISITYLAIFLYLAGTIIFWDPNPGNWTDTARYILAIYLLSFITIILIEKQKHP
jgi:hypothetical protein